MKEPIFINGQYRTRTTWWFTKFRESDKTHCYYTPLAPALSDNSPNDRGFFSNEKTLRHELTDHYFMEYPHFEKILPTARDWSQHPYVMGPNDKNLEMKAHITSLIDYAYSLGKTPVFKLNNALLRGAWLKENFGGVHIYLFRDFQSITASFESEGIADWAWAYTISDIGQNCNHPVIAPIANHLGYHPEKTKYSESGKKAISFWKDKHEKGIFNETTKLEVVTYLQSLALHHAENHYADIIIKSYENITRIEKSIKELTGISLDLSSFDSKKSNKLNNDVQELDLNYLIKPAILNLEELMHF